MTEQERKELNVLFDELKDLTDEMNLLQLKVNNLLNGFEKNADVEMIDYYDVSHNNDEDYIKKLINYDLIKNYNCKNINYYHFYTFDDDFRYLNPISLNVVIKNLIINEYTYIKVDHLNKQVTITEYRYF